MKEASSRNGPEAGWNLGCRDVFAYRSIQAAVLIARHQTEDVLSQLYGDTRRRKPRMSGEARSSHPPTTPVSTNFAACALKESIVKVEVD